METKEFKGNKGITLIALVITIIVLLILAGVTIATLTGENGILKRASQASEENTHAAVKEAIGLAYNEYQIEINTVANESHLKEMKKIASTQIVTIQGKEEKQKVSQKKSFFEFLEEKLYISEDGKVNVEKLLGKKQTLGNGNATEKKDVYMIEKIDEQYILNYYNKEGNSETLWQVNNISEVNNEYYIGNPQRGLIGLMNTKTNQPTTFSEAYILDEGEWKDITDLINEYDGMSSITGSRDT